jgi:hypothetical protein
MNKNDSYDFPQNIEMNRKGDWWCPTCEFTIWGSKSKCSKCGYEKPAVVTAQKREEVAHWKSGDDNPEWNRFGPYSTMKGGYYGNLVPGEPEGLKYPRCGCDHLQHCPKRHHTEGCNCYTCRCKTGKW